MEIMIFSESFFYVEEGGGEKQALQEYMKEPQLFRDNVDYWKLCVIFSIRSSLADDEESSNQGSENNSAYSVPFTQDEISSSVELKMIWYLNEMLSYDIDVDQISLIVDLISNMYGLSKDTQMKMKKLMYTKSMMLTDDEMFGQHRERSRTDSERIRLYDEESAFVSDNHSSNSAQKSHASKKRVYYDASTRYYL